MTTDRLVLRTISFVMLEKYAINVGVSLYRFSEEPVTFSSERLKLPGIDTVHVVARSH